VQLRTSERIIRAEWSQVIECAPGRRAGRTRRGDFKKATPCRGAASRRRTRCHARGFARARTHGRAIASPRLALSQTLGPRPTRAITLVSLVPCVRAGSRSMLSTCSQLALSMLRRRIYTRPLPRSYGADARRTRIWSDDRVLCFHGLAGLFCQFGLWPARS
jgi:hypothetical protein